MHVIMGQLIMDTPFTRALHSNNSLGIMSELQKHDRVVVTEVPYQLHEHEAAARPPPASSDFQQMMDHIDAYTVPATERAP